ncbi:MAG: hypothetical protein Kow00109_20280 [Acidobacteriota bacterium]
MDEDQSAQRGEKTSDKALVHTSSYLPQVLLKTLGALSHTVDPPQSPSEILGDT